MSIHLRFLAFGLAAICFAPASAVASEVPAQLRNKTLSLSWSAQRRVMTPRGERQGPSTSFGRLIYISSNGRFFVKATRGNRSAEIAPGGKTPRGGARDMKFVGGKIVAMAQRGQGAGQMIVSFDPGYSSCSVRLTFGKPSGKRITFTGRRGVPVELLGVTYSGESCSIREGNAFAN